MYVRMVTITVGIPNAYQNRTIQIDFTQSGGPFIALTRLQWQALLIEIERRGLKAVR